VIIEAMTYFKPVIGTDIGGIVDIIIDNKTGLLVPQRNSGAIAGAVTKIFSDPLLTKRLVANGFDHVRKNFSWTSVIERFMSVYSSLKQMK
jgi:glycosyltransferase involved in cell wall biosynthesis